MAQVALKWDIRNRKYFFRYIHVLYFLLCSQLPSILVGSFSVLIQSSEMKSSGHTKGIHVTFSKELRNSNKEYMYKKKVFHLLQLQ